MSAEKREQNIGKVRPGSDPAFSLPGVHHFSNVIPSVDIRALVPSQVPRQSSWVNSQRLTTTELGERQQYKNMPQPGTYRGGKGADAHPLLNYDHRYSTPYTDSTSKDYGGQPKPTSTYFNAGHGNIDSGLHIRPGMSGTKSSSRVEPYGPSLASGYFWRRELPLPQVHIAHYSPNSLNTQNSPAHTNHSGSVFIPKPLNILQKPPVESSPILKDTRPSRVTEQTSSPVIEQTPRQVFGDPISQKEIEEVFKKLIPAMKSINLFKFDDLPAQLLSHCDNLFTLDEFYNLIFNFEVTENRHVSDKRLHTFDISQLFPFELKSLRLNALVLGFLRLPEGTTCHIKGIPIDNFRRPGINLHEFSRVLLAMRILQVSIMKVTEEEDQLSSLARDDVYRAYCILCQKQILQNSPSTSLKMLTEQLILCRTRVGKLCKLVFLGWPQRRFGKRGKSRFHFVGAKWNDAVIDEETRTMVKLGLSDVASYRKSSAFKSVARRGGSVSSTASERLGTAGELASPDSSSCPKISKSSEFSRNLSYTFIGPRMRFPAQDCAPRDWSRVKGNPPKASPWASQLSQESLLLFGQYGFDLGPLILHFKFGTFIVDGPLGLLVTVTNIIHWLLDTSAPPRAFHHFYLIFLLLVFPSIIASDVEISALQKLRLRKSINLIVTEFESAKLYSISSDEKSIGKFLKVLRSMLLLGELTLKTIKTAIFEDVMEVLDRNIDLLAIMEDGTCEKGEVLEEAFFRGFVVSTKVYDLDLTALVFDPASKTGLEDDTVAVLREMVKKFTLETKSLKDKHVEILTDFRNQEVKGSSQTLARDLFETLVQIIHRTCLRDPTILQMPMRSYTYILLQVMNLLQKITFQEFGKYEPELSLESFKCWYMACALIHEYMGILCEIVALKETVG